MKRIHYPVLNEVEKLQIIIKKEVPKTWGFFFISSKDSFLRPFTITNSHFLCSCPDAPVSYTNGKVKSNNAWGISGNFLSCNSLYPTQTPINLCLTKTYYATTAFIGKTSILIHFLWNTAPPHYWDTVFMPKYVTQISIWSTHVSHLTGIISVQCTSLTAVFSMVSKWH